MRCFLLIALLAACWNAASADDAKREVVAKPTDLSKELSSDEMKAAQLKVCIQPSYDAWEKVQRGMTVEEVKELLGEPLEQTDDRPLPWMADAEMQWVQTMTFGRIEFDSPQVPQSIDYYIEIVDGKVIEKRTPFNAMLASSDKPSTPTKIIPVANARFSHYPRYVDLRWYPSSGAYPISYEVEVQYGNEEYVEAPFNTVVYTGIRYEKEDSERLTTDVPCSLSCFPGAGHGRWRVRATNNSGKSDWSSWWKFEFSN